jgi:hypothetical protein
MDHPVARKPPRLHESRPKAEPKTRTDSLGNHLVGAVVVAGGDEVEAEVQMKVEAAPPGTLPAPRHPHRLSSPQRFLRSEAELKRACHRLTDLADDPAIATQQVRLRPTNTDRLPIPGRRQPEMSCPYWNVGDRNQVDLAALVAVLPEDVCIISIVAPLPTTVTACHELDRAVSLSA